MLNGELEIDAMTPERTGRAEGERRVVVVVVVVVEFVLVVDHEIWGGGTGINVEATSGASGLLLDLAE